MSTTFSTTHRLTGAAATRTSASRTYAYAVWAIEPAERFVAGNEQQVANLTEYVAKGHWTAEEAADGIARAQARITEGPVWGVAGWCGRYDLAVSLAAQMQRRGYLTVIEEATVVAKPVRKTRAAKATAVSAPVVPSYVEDLGLLF